MALDTAATMEVYKDSTAALEARVEDLFARLTLEEKIQLMAGAAYFALPEIARLGVPSLRMTDGPTGVRSNVGQAATVFPVAVALAATWNPALAGEVAAAIAREAQALGEHVVLAPTININRTPLWGRNFETYSEDPYLAGELAIDYVRGLQGEGIGASLKHYAANNQEHRRMDVSVELDERTLREIYTAAFERVVKAANPWTVMASYNKVRGTYATENRHLLTAILKEEWGYDGVVVSDWGAVHSTAPPARAGLDLEMPGPPKFWGHKLLKAVQDGEVDQGHIDEAARRLVRLILRCGLLDGPDSSQGGPPKGELRTPRHQAIAKRAATEAFVLLKNDGSLLPWDSAKIGILAVIGPNAETMRLQGDGSSHVRLGRRPTPLDSLRALLGNEVAISYAKGVDNDPFPPATARALFSPDSTRDVLGLLLEHFEDAECSGDPVRTTIDRRMTKWISALTPPALRENFKALRWSGFFWPEKDGEHEFSLRGDGDCVMRVGDQTVIDTNTPAIEDAHDPTGASAKLRIGKINLAAGKGYPITVEYKWAPARADAPFEVCQIGMRQPSGTIEEAVEVARAADAVLLMVGSAASTESEGYDRDDIKLPGKQDELVEAILAANPRTVVAINAGAPMAMPWIDKAPTVLLTWLPGEEGPDVLADILFGRAAPSGRLPVTFPKRIEDNPSYPYYPGGDESHYGEGLFVGYRHYDAAGIAPLFPFGHGLTYTRFDYGDLEVQEQVALGESVKVRVRVTNVGQHPGDEVVQVYIQPKAPSKPRPVKELKGFAKVHLAPGEIGTIDLTLTEGDFAFFDADLNRWVTEAGGYDIVVGASASDIRLSKTVTLTAG
jgi:beta-glucosidase